VKQLILQATVALSLREGK